MDVLRGLSADGKLVLYMRSGPSAYLRRTDTSAPAVRLGEGRPLALSDDGAWVLVSRPGTPATVVVMPTGAGESHSLETGDVEIVGGIAGALSHDGKRVVYTGRRPGQPSQVFVQDIEGGAPRLLTPGGEFWSSLTTRDGRSAVAVDKDRVLWLFPLDGSEPRRLPGPPETAVEEELGPWTNDGRGLLTTENGGRVSQVFRRDLATGRRELIREIRPADPIGLVGFGCISAAEGRAYACAYAHWLNSVYVVDGLR